MNFNLQITSFALIIVCFTFTFGLNARYHEDREYNLRHKPYGERIVKRENSRDFKGGFGVNYERGSGGAFGNGNEGWVAVRKGKDNNDSGPNTGPVSSFITREDTDYVHSTMVAQERAAQQAEYKAKQTLADQAKQEAAMAAAAVNGKQTIVDTLHKAAQEAEKEIGIERAQYEESQRAAWASQNAAVNANKQVEALTVALKSAQNNAKAAEKAANDAEQEVGTQERMVEMAKIRFEQTNNQYKAALEDLRETRAQADRAAAEAATAASNVAKIAVEMIPTNQDYKNHRNY